ncbi:hypothetical protein FB107DRAFT_211875 [Schizophyllum commune]
MENKQTPPLSSPSVEIMLQQILQAVQTSSDGLAQVRKECEELRRTNARLESQLVHHESGHASSSLPAAASSSAAAKGATLAATRSLPATASTTSTIDAKCAPSVESVAPSATIAAASSPLSIAKATSAPSLTPAKPPSTLAKTPTTLTKTPAKPSSPPSPFIGAVKPAYASGFTRQPIAIVQPPSTEMKSTPRPSAMPIRPSATATRAAATTSPATSPAPSAAARRQALAAAQRAEPLPGDEPSQFCRTPRGPYADLLRRAVC